MEKQRREEMEATAQGSTGQKSSRRNCNASYDAVNHFQSNSISSLLETVRFLENQLGQLPPQKWSTIWSKTEIPLLSETSLAKTDDFTRQGSDRSYCRSSHRRSTMNLLIRGRILGPLAESGSNQLVYSHRPHRFEKYNYNTPTNCDYCRTVLWGLVTKQGIKCTDCGFNCHEKCVDSVSKNCQGYKGTRKLSLTQESSQQLIPSHNGTSTSANNEVQENAESVQRNRVNHNNSYASDGRGVAQNSLNHSETCYDHFTNSIMVENRTHQGYLNKKGALLKSWKERWFVLDSTKYQLRCYDAEDDHSCKSIIDLKDVTAVNPTTDPLVFELKTAKRAYCFMAPSNSSAQEWFEKIQAVCLV
jgi:myotubularin-related protein 5/13